MRRIARFLGSLAAVSFAVAGCSGMDGSDIVGAPPEPEPPQPPDSLPPTGQIWDEVILEGDCGHKTISWVLVDEMCGATDAEDYLARFRVPMFRDGVAIGNDLYVVDGTNLWALDITSADSIPRKALTTGIGTPIAMAEHAGDLVIAAGDEGLLLLDVTDPAAPVRTATIELDGLALDVHIDGDRALVAMGKAGVAVVDLLSDPPAVVQTVPVPGFTAGVTAQGDMAYVAACESLAIVDLAAGGVVGQTWLEPGYAYVGDYLVAPAKDVAVEGNLAFVAAGRFGSVVVDVTDPAAPAVAGNCTIDDDLKFYASGVRGQGGKVFVAGGEWGVLPVEGGQCAALVFPSLPEYPLSGEDKDAECSTDPPWDVVPWQTIWSPPPPGYDPIQTFPAGDIVYAFGDARRNALRAVDVKDTTQDGLPNIGRYQEPRLVTGIAANGNVVAVLGDAGGVFVRDDVQLLAPQLDVPSLPVDAVAVGVLGDGRWVAASDAGKVLVHGEPVLDLGAQVWPFGLQTSGASLAVAGPTGVTRLDTASGETTTVPSGETAQLPSSLLWGPDGFVLAAPEWPHAVTLTPAGDKAALQDHGVFSAQDILQTSLWRRGVPTRMLLGSEVGLVEVATLGGRAGLFVHSTGGRVELPRGEYRGGAAVGKRAYLVSADRSAYRTRLVTVDVSDPAPAVLAVESFLGVGTGVAVDGDRLYVADGDRGIRVYARTDDALTLLGVVNAKEVTP